MNELFPVKGGHYESVFDEANNLKDILSPAPDEEYLLIPEKPITHNSETLICCFPPLTEEQEYHLFRKMNCLKHLASKATDHENTDLLAHATRIRNIILKHNMRLIYSIIKPYSKTSDMLSELFNEAILWMIGVIDAYDYRMENNHFSAFAVSCIRKRIWSYFKSVQKKAFISDDSILESLEDHRTDTSQELEKSLEKLHVYIQVTVSDKRTRDIILKRLGLEDGIFHSFKQLAEDYGVSYQAVQQKFDQSMIVLFGKTVDGNTLRTIQGRQQDKRIFSS